MKIVYGNGERVGKKDRVCRVDSFWRNSAYEPPANRKRIAGNKRGSRGSEFLISDS